MEERGSDIDCRLAIVRSKLVVRLESIGLYVGEKALGAGMNLSSIYSGE